MVEFSLFTDVVSCASDRLVKVSEVTLQEFSSWIHVKYGLLLYWRMLSFEWDFVTIKYGSWDCAWDAEGSKQMLSNIHLTWFWMYGLKITDEREVQWKAQLAKQGWIEGLKEKEFDLLEYFCITCVPKANPGVSEFSSNWKIRSMTVLHHAHEL